MNQVKYNKFKNSTIKLQSASKDQNKSELPRQVSNSKDKMFYQYSIEATKNKQSISNEEKTMSSEDLNDKIKEIIAKHGGYIPSEQSLSNEVDQDMRNQSSRIKHSEFKQNDKKKQIETQLKKLSSSGSSSTDRFNKLQYKTDINNGKSNRLKTNGQSSISKTINNSQNNNQYYIYEQDQSTSLDPNNCEGTANYSFSEGISSAEQIQESKLCEDIKQLNQSKQSKDNNKFSQRINESFQNQVNESIDNQDANQSFGNQDEQQQQQRQNSEQNSRRIETDFNKLFTKKQQQQQQGDYDDEEEYQPKFSTPVKQSINYEQNNNGSGGFKSFNNYNQSNNNFPNNSIVNSINENSIKKAQPNSKLSLENSIKNIKIKNLTRIKLIVKPPLLVSEICRGIVGLFCLTGEINEDENFLSKMNNEWLDIQPLFGSPGQLMNIICRTKSLIKSGKINERNIRYVSKTLDSIEQLVKMEEDSRQIDEIQDNHFEYQVIMENMVVFVDFLGATCDYFFRTSQSNLPISIDTYLNTSMNKKQQSIKQPVQSVEIKEQQQPQSIQISSYLEEFRDQSKVGLQNNLCLDKNNLQKISPSPQNNQSGFLNNNSSRNNQSARNNQSTFNTSSSQLQNKPETYPKLDSNQTQSKSNIQNKQQVTSQNSSALNKSPAQNNKKFINSTPQKQGNQKYFLSNSRNNMKIEPNHDSSCSEINNHTTPLSYQQGNTPQNKYIQNKQYPTKQNNLQNKNNQILKVKSNLSLNKTSDTYFPTGSPSTQKLNSTFMTNATQSRSQTPTSDALLSRSQSKLRRISSNKNQLDNSYNQPNNKSIQNKYLNNTENQENHSSINFNKSLSKSRIIPNKPTKETTHKKNVQSNIIQPPSEQDFRKNRLEKIMELKVKKPKVESFVKKMINGDPVYQDVLLKKPRQTSTSRGRNINQNDSFKTLHSHVLSGTHKMCDPYEQQKSHLSEKLNEVQNQVIKLSQQANKVEWDDKRYAKQSLIQEESDYQKFDLNFKKEEHSRLKEFQKSVYEDEKQLLKEQSENTYLMNRSRREYEKSVEIQNNADEEFKNYIEMKYKQAMTRRQMIQQKNDLNIKKEEYEDVRNYKSHQKSFDIIEQRSRYGDEEVNRLNYSIQKSVERKNELEKRLEKTLDVIYNFRKLTSFKNLNDSQ